MKIGTDFFKTLTVPSKAITVEVGGVSYDITVKQELVLDEKIEMVKSLLDLVKELPSNDENSLTAASLISVYKAITDIEFPEDSGEKVLQMEKLIQSGILAEVNKNLPEGFLEKTMKFVESTLIELKNQIVANPEEIAE